MQVSNPIPGPTSLRNAPSPRARLSAPATLTVPLTRQESWVAALLAAPIAVVLAHGLATVLRAWLASGDRPAAWPIAIASLAAVVGFGVMEHSRFRGSSFPFWCCSVASSLGVLITTSSLPDAAAVLLATSAVGLLREVALRRLSPLRIPVKSLAARSLWTMLALLAVVQTTRLSSYMTDIETGWYLTTDHPWWADHMCSTAYFHAAELHQRGEVNVYEARHYPALDQAAAPTTHLEHLDGHIEDPFQYPPTFLLYPLALMSFTSDFAVMRSLGFVLQFFVVVSALAAFVHWLGGLRRELGFWCLPLIFGAVPMLQNFQYGQVHVTTFALCLLALVAFDRRKAWIGGGFLALAIGAKLFPAVLLPLLAMQRRWRDLATTGLMLLALCGLSVAAVGTAPFEAFWSYQIPALQSGAAFAFDQVWPEMREPVVTINLSISRVWDRLYELGLVSSEQGGVWLTRAYAAGVAVLCLLFARRASSRTGQALAWLGLLNLAVLHAGGGWADYVTAPALLISLLLLAEAQAKPSILWIVGIGSGLLFLALGVQPMPELLPAPGGYVASLLFALFVMGWNAWAVIRSPKTGDLVEA